VGCWRGWRRSVTRIAVGFVGVEVYVLVVFPGELLAHCL